MVIKKPKVMKRSDSRANSLFGGMSQVNMVSPKGSSSSVTSKLKFRFNKLTIQIEPLRIVRTTKIFTVKFKLEGPQEFASY